MTLNRTSRLSIFALALAYTGVTFAVATAPAPLEAADGPYYVAKLTQPADDDRAVAGGIAWACRDTTCVANKGNSRPLRICRGLAREFGEIAEFTAEGAKMEDGDLAKCNGN
jgi:hypothetical protein